MIGLRFVISILTFGSIGLLSGLTMPLVLDRYYQMGLRRVEEATRQLNGMFVEVKKPRLCLIYTLTPVVLGTIGLLLFHNFIIGLVAAGLGIILPTFVIKNLEAKRRRKFSSQLVDGLMILSGSLKAGLSILQAIETLVEEMPPPISQEFGLVLRENKMGVLLDESLERLNSRMKDEDLNLMLTAMTVARETGGDLTQTIAQLIATLREKKKLMEKVKTLTTQGKIQGVFMSILPIIFVVVIYRLNPGFKDLMLHTQIGRVLLGFAVFLEIIGICLIRILSRVEA